MDVVAAGMRIPSGSGKGKAALLRHLQRIHVPPQEEHLPSGPADAGGDSARQFLWLNAQCIQLLADMGHRVGELHPQLRHLVEGAAAGHQRILFRQRFLIEQLHFQHDSVSFLALMV